MTFKSLIVLATMQVHVAILTKTGPSFLGIGIDPQRLAGVLWSPVDVLIS